MRFKVNYKVSSLEKDVDTLVKDMKSDITRRSRLLVQKVSGNGVEVARREYEEAVNAGSKSSPQSAITLKYSDDGMKGEVVGLDLNQYQENELLFIEFGTGVRFPYDAPEAKEHFSSGGSVIYPHGKFGKKKGSNPKGWFYKGQMPSNPPEGTEEAYSRKGSIKTYGQPAQPVMYDAWKEMNETLPEVAKEVFSK